MKHLLSLSLLLGLWPASGLAQPSRDQVMATMKRATTFMVDKVAW